MSTLSLFLESAIGLALLAALLFALADQIQNVGLANTDPQSGAIVSITAGTIGLWCLAPWLTDRTWFLTIGAIAFAIVGLLRPSLSMTLALMGTVYLGPTLVSALMLTSPVFTSALAIAVLGESLSSEIAIGTLAVVAGVIVAAVKPGKACRTWPLWALALPIGGALFRAFAHVGTKFGYDSVPSWHFAALVSYTVSSVVAFVIFRAQGLRFAGTLVAYKWFVIGGLLNAAALCAINGAMQIGTLVTVIPIAAMGPMFTLLLGVLVFRREVITWRTVAAVVLVTAGAVLVVRS